MTTSTLTLVWSEPDQDGGAPVLSYSLEMKASTEPDFHPYAKIDGDVLTTTCVKLKPDTSYEFRIFAENEAGLSTEPCLLSPPVTTKSKASMCVCYLTICLFHEICKYFNGFQSVLTVY